MCSRGGTAGEHSACMWLNLLVWRHYTPVVNIIQYAFWLNALPTQGVRHANVSTVLECLPHPQLFLQNCLGIRVVYMYMGCESSL